MGVTGDSKWGLVSKEGFCEELAPLFEPPTGLGAETSASEGLLEVCDGVREATNALLAS